MSFWSSKVTWELNREWNLSLDYRSIYISVLLLLHAHVQSWNGCVTRLLHKSFVKGRGGAGWIAGLRLTTSSKVAMLISSAVSLLSNGIMLDFIHCGSVRIVKRVCLATLMQLQARVAIQNDFLKACTLFNPQLYATFQQCPCPKWYLTACSWCLVL